MPENQKNFDEFEENCDSVNKITDFANCSPAKNFNSPCDSTTEFNPLPKKAVQKNPFSKHTVGVAQKAVKPFKFSPSLFITIAAAVVFAISCAMIPYIVSFELSPQPEIATDSIQPGIPAKENGGDVRESDIRIFKKHGEKVGVFFPGGELDFIIDVSVESLPEYDRLLLENGIIAQGSEEIAFVAEGLEQ